MLRLQEIDTMPTSLAMSSARREAWETVTEDSILASHRFKGMGAQDSALLLAASSALGTWFCPHSILNVRNLRNYLTENLRIKALNTAL
jgi:hypothetical protein